MRIRFVHVSLAALILLAAACGEKQRRAPSLGEAFIGPISVDIREDIPTTSKVVGTGHHGERVDIVQTRRRFIKVRLPNGKEGWTDSLKLLTADQMEQLSTLAEYAAKIPSMGRATVFDALNMHGDPNRYSVSFYQLSAGVPVEVLVRRVTERTPPPAPEPLVKRAPPVPKKKKPVKEKKQPSVPPPPTPPAPGLPSNWLELSKTNSPEPPKPVEEDKEDEPAAPKRYDDWTLVRTKDGKAGWVLSRMLTMSIPDEVAQYSEGARITAYFPLGEVEDSEAGRKKHWLWTTLRNTTGNYDFDSFRVFIWNARRHRYETSYIERNLVGFHPVRVEGPKFTVLLKNNDGNYYTKTFELEGYITRWLGNAPAAPPKDPLAGLDSNGEDEPAQESPQPLAQKSTKDKLKEWVKGLFGKKS